MATSEYTPTHGLIPWLLGKGRATPGQAQSAGTATRQVSNLSNPDNALSLYVLVVVVAFLTGPRWAGARAVLSPVK